MIQSPFRIAIVGCGRIATRHLRACLASRAVDIVALVDAVRDRAESLAAESTNKPVLATDVGDVLGEIDGAIIATPNHLHRDLAVRCLHEGVSVLIEKPLAGNMADGEEICRASEESGKVAAVGYVTRHRANVQFMKRLLNREYFGHVRRFAYQFGSRGGWAPLSAYNLDRAATGGGVLVVTGTHFLDRLLYWFGYPEDVELEDDSEGGPEANAIAHFRFCNGGANFAGTARFSKTVKLPAGIVMETERGTVILEDEPDACIRFRPRDQGGMEVRLHELPESQVDRRPAADAFQLQLEDFVRGCTAESKPMVTAKDGLECIRLVEHLYASRRPLSTAWYASREMEPVRP